MKSTLWSKLVILVLCTLYFLLLAQPTNLTTADLGRHLKNGQIILNSQFSTAQAGASLILNSNSYSYTFANFPFINHHWGSGVLFYLLFQIAGFFGLSIIYILLSIITFLLFFYISYKNSNLLLATLLSILTIPLLASRNEIRPEAISYLFCGVFFLILYQVIHQKISSKWLWLLPVVELFWVNLHVYFPLGLIILGAFWVEQIFQSIKNKQPSLVVKLSLVGLICALVTLINPNGLAGALYPTHIFDSYGYNLLENQSIFNLENVINYPSGIFFKILFATLILSWLVPIYQIIKKKIPITSYLSLVTLSLVFGYLGFSAVRNFTIFGLFALPIICLNLKTLSLGKSFNQYKSWYIGSAFTSLIIALLYLSPSYWQQHSNLGLGVVEGINKSAQFFTENNLQGPIFNNYDIGGYLIYHLYPKTPVFVDNRPEAYPTDFFKQVYIPMQQDNNIWQIQDQKYHFNSIFFQRNDLTPWGQAFLINRIKDPDWAPVFVDNYTIIFLKRNGQNKSLIQKFELPKEMFKVS